MNEQQSETAVIEDKWDVERAARFLGMSTHWLYKQVERARIPHAYVGRALRFEPKELQRWFDEQKRAAKTGGVQ